MRFYENLRCLEAKRHERLGLGPKGHEQLGLGPKGARAAGTWSKGARAAGWSELKEVQQEVQQHDTAGKADEMLVEQAKRHEKLRRS
jgi:hypothetical protein